MRIVIDASRTTIARRTGTENYALQLIRALLEMRSPHEFILCFRDKPHPDLFKTYKNVHHRVIPFPRLWTHIRFAAALWHLRPDITFVPAHSLPSVFPGRAVVTVHDLGYCFFPEAHPAAQRRYLDQTTRYSAHRATRILADSQATKHDLMAQYHVAEAKIDVVYPGVQELQRAPDPKIAAAKAKYGLPASYLLFLGTLQPRKNIGRLLQAFARCIESYPNIGLVLAGKRGWLTAEIDDLLPTLPESVRVRIVMCGYVADEDVTAVYSGALAFVFPSLYEGFGFPVLEAMRCGTPVLCSNTSSLPELGGDAALLVDPLSMDAIADGIAKLISQADLRATLTQRGYQQVAQFTWARAAAQTLHTLERAGSSR